MIQKGDIVKYRYLESHIGLVLNTFYTEVNECYLPIQKCAYVLWSKESDIMTVNVSKLIKINFNETR